MANLDPMIIFLVTGFVSMSAALSAGAINKLPSEARTGALASKTTLMWVVLSGNLAAVTLIGSGAYGMRHLDWWLPLICIFVTFPVAHILVFQRVLGDLKNLMLMMPLVVVSIGVLYYFW